MGGVNVQHEIPFLKNKERKKIINQQTLTPLKHIVI